MTKRITFNKRWVELGYNSWANKKFHYFKLTDGFMLVGLRFKILVKTK